MLATPSRGPWGPPTRTACREADHANSDSWFERPAPEAMPASASFDRLHRHPSNSLRRPLSALATHKRRSRRPVGETGLLQAALTSSNTGNGCEGPASGVSRPGSSAPVDVRVVWEALEVLARPYVSRVGDRVRFASVVPLTRAILTQ